MSQTTVYELLDRIRELPTEERLMLDALLAEQEEAEWSQEAASVRRLARQRGTDQEAIDQAVAAIRRGG